MQTIKSLIELLTLEKIDENLFRGQSYVTPWRRVFGGQVLGQALHAAYQTVPSDRFAHSMHGYFILTGDVEKPIIYEVDTIRDGGSFTTRRVVAKQNGKAIFNMAASFQLVQEGFNHQIETPEVLQPDALLPDFKQLERLRDTHPGVYRRLTIMHPNAIEFRPVEDFHLDKKEAAKPKRHVWFKSSDDFEADLPMQHQIMAYASDYNLLTTSSLPHLDKIDMSSWFIASLDHALWFHRDFTLDDWLLYATDSPSASNSRGFCRGSIFDKHGNLVASVAQEGLMRQLKRK